MVERQKQKGDKTCSVIHFGWGTVDNKNLRTTSNLSKSGLLHNREKERATDKRQDSAITVYTESLGFYLFLMSVPVVPLWNQDNNN